MYLELTTYQGLKDILKQFHKNIWEILILEGSPGTGKTTIVQNSFPHESNHLYIQGKITPAKLYQLLYQYQDNPVVLDDNDSLTSDKSSLELLKSLCNGGENKTLSWLTTRKLPDGIPQQFSTSSQVIFITNNWNKMSKYFAALEDRGLHCLFIPSKNELHNFAQNMVDPEVWLFHDLFLHAIENLTLRSYITAQKLTNTGEDWRRFIISSWGLDLLQVLYIQLQLEYPTSTEDERQQKFLAITGKTIRAWDRVKMSLLAR